MKDNTTNRAFQTLVRNAFPSDEKSRINLIEYISSSDHELALKVANFFSDKAWTDLNLQELNQQFESDSGLAFYILPENERRIFLPTILWYHCTDAPEISGFEYVLENTLSEFIGEYHQLSKGLSRDQLAVSMSILAYVCVEDWQVPSDKNLAAFIRLINGH